LVEINYRKKFNILDEVVVVVIFFFFVIRTIK